MASIYRLGTQWRAQIRRKGHEPLSQLFDTKSEAQRWAHAQEHKIQNLGIKSRSKSRMTIGELADAYIKAFAEANKKYGRTKRDAINYLGRVFKGQRISNLSKEIVIEHVKRRRKEGLAPSTAGTELTYLKVLLTHGAGLAGVEAEAEHAVGQLVTARRWLTHFGFIASQSRQRERRPTEEELHLIEDWVNERKWASTPIFDVVLFAICTGMRLGEICGPKGATWEDLDLTSRLLTVRGRKDPTKPEGRDMVIPLVTGPVIYRGQVVDPVEIILRQRTAKRRRGRIFPYATGTIGQAFAKATVDKGIVDLHFHDLRHDAISRLAEAGWSLPQMAAVSGHLSWKNLQRYTQIDPKTLHRLK